MRLRMITAMAGASLLLFSGTAAASSYPVENAPKLTDNALYAGAKPVRVTCGRTLSKGMTAASTQKYLSRLVACMNTSWMPVLRAAGFTVTPPSVAVGRIMPRCGGYSADGAVGSQVLSCRHVIRVQLASDWISARDDLTILTEISRAYSLYVMDVTGITHASQGVRRHVTGSEAGELSRRHDLQTDCLSGALLKSVWTSPNRSAAAWNTLLTRVTGGQGKVATRRYWIKRGFATGAPASCNTWKATSKAVA